MNITNTPDQDRRYLAYMDELRSAFEASAALGADNGQMRIYLNQACTPETAETLEKVALGAVGMHEFDPWECLMSAQTVAKAVRIALQPAPAYLTLGYIQVGSEVAYHFIQDDLRDWIASPLPRNSYPIHAWVTLGTLEVLDAAIIPRSRHREFRLPGAVLRGSDVVMEHPRDWQRGIVYHPVAVGENLIDLLLK